jgi:hypothetical protein
MPKPIPDPSIPRLADTPPSPDRQPWEKRPDEGHKAFRAFQEYCKLGGERSTGQVAANIRKTPNLIKGWSSAYDWVARAAAYDDHMGRLEQGRREKVRAEFAERWERRRLEAAEANWDRAQRLALRAEEMLRAPLYEQEVTQEIIDPKTGESRPIAITLTPAKWTFGQAAAILKTVAELQAAALVEALGGNDDGFDPATASPDECRAYLAKQGVKALPPPAK